MIFQNIVILYRNYMPLFVDNEIFYVENPKKSILKLLEINEPNTESQDTRQTYQ